MQNPMTAAILESITLKKTWRFPKLRIHFGGRVPFWGSSKGGHRGYIGTYIGFRVPKIKGTYSKYSNILGSDLPTLFMAIALSAKICAPI